MSAARRELYVYYRVGAHDLARAMRIVEQAQSDLRADYPGLVVRLLRRVDETVSDSVTLMEVYRTDDGVDDTVQRRIHESAAALTSLVIGARHTETFTPLASDDA